MDGPATLAGSAPPAAVEAIRAAGRRLDSLGWVPATAGRYAWAEAGAEVSGAAGRHDLYLILDTEGVAVSQLTFVAGGR